MKRRILIVLLSVLALLALSFGFSACSGRDGKDGADGTDGVNGIDGEDGVGIENTYINADGDLIVVLSDGREINCGGVLSGGIGNAYINEAGDLILVLNNGQTINCGNVTVNGGESGENFFFNAVKEDGEVIGYSVRGIGSVSQCDIVIPSSYNGKPVISIRDRAFEGCDWLTGVTIPNTVVSIGEYAFYECASLEFVSAGRGLESVGKFAFGRCASLRDVYIFDAGNWCEIDFANMSANPLYFAQNLYLGNSLLTELVISDSVTKIGGYTFYEVGSLTSVTAGNGVKEIGIQAFYGCANIQSFSAGSSLSYIGEEAFWGCCNLKTAALGDSLEKIEEYAFYGCSALEEIIMPSALREIGECAFADCASLKSVSFNEGLESIDAGAFAGCIALGSFIMPDSVKFIGFGVVMFEVGGGFDAIGVMYNALTEIHISDSLTELPDFAFSHSNIKSVEIGSSVQTVGYSAFYGCELLERVIIPKSVNKITSYAFYRCEALKEVFYAGTAEEWALINIGKNGNDITNETVTTYFYSETMPSGEGSYWHYVDGEVTVW